ncbi:hypothetical protein BP00DRAFT_411697 [Aspergillus indologenus CBS 114.80]|uniref:Xylanolytic transcriptional activator regulatory domain-containing protein n=1 Tax=Aspergillus indologenus CBS 114.80 TaxID=1450541 RepID=A0A2V5J2I6_9EURO|nr:hypothetical protein BP00DRAFT_411697 [Aspergillus indologenus CBS 114.80]
MAFFSESHIRSLTTILGHTRLRDLLEGMGQHMHQHVHDAGIRFRSPETPVCAAPEDAARYIAAYFQALHPLAPFLDRTKFEQQAFGPRLAELLAESAPFSALYHTVLASGCQYTEGGSFKPGQGKAWKYFQVALGLFPSLLGPSEGLFNVQALTAMALFASSFSCVQIGETLISEAARMVQVLGYNAAYILTEDEKLCHRVFWVIYWQEQVTCFFRGRASMIPEYDIGCPVPDVPESVIGQLDWLLTTARLGRLMSRMYERLFSVSAVQTPKAERIAAINSMSAELESWACSMSPEFRPSQNFRSANFSNPCAHEMALQLRTIYHALLMTLCRLRIHLTAAQPGEPDQETKRRLMETARAVIYDCRHIDHEAHVPVWELGIVPVSAVFVIFDFVIHNPFHAETNTNLAYLDIAAGFFSRWDISDKDTLPPSTPAEFSHIAREFVQNLRARSQQQPDASGNTTNTPLDRRRSEHNVPPPASQPPRDPQSAADSSHTANDEAASLTEYFNTSATNPDYLFYPEDPLQPILGTSMFPTMDLAFMFNAALWSPQSSGP